MSYQAKWGNKGFIVSAEKIMSMQNLRTTRELKTSNGNDTSGKSTSNTRGVETQDITFSVTYLRAAGTDPRAQYESWNSEIGQIYPLYIGGKRFGPQRMQLVKVSLSDSMFSATGEFLSVTLEITLREKATVQASSSKSGKSSGSGAKATAKKETEAEIFARIDKETAEQSAKEAEKKKANATTSLENEWEAALNTNAPLTDKEKIGVKTNAALQIMRSTDYKPIKLKYADIVIEGKRRLNQ